VGRSKVKTASIRTICGDLVFADRIVFHKTDLDTKGTLSVYEVKGDCEIKLGEGTINLVGAKPEKKITLMNLREELLGEAYIDCTQEDQEC
jgi:hypothetical protein